MNKAYYGYFNELKEAEKDCLEEIEKQMCTELKFLRYNRCFRKYNEHIACKRWAPELFDEETIKHIENNIDEIVNINEIIIQYHYHNSEAEYAFNSYGETIYLSPALMEIRENSRNKKRR